MKQYKRSTRLSEQIMRDVSTFFLAELSHNAPDLITFTRVDLTNDLKYATVYYSCLGDEKKQEMSLNYLNQNGKKIRHAIGKNLHMRFIPEFRFKFDPSIAEGIHIEKLLNEIKSNE